VEAAEQHGHRTKKTLEIDPIQADTVRLTFRLAREGAGTSGPMGVKSIAKHLNATGIRTRDGSRWGLGSISRCCPDTCRSAATCTRSNTMAIGRWCGGRVRYRDETGRNGGDRPANVFRRISTARVRSADNSDRGSLTTVRTLRA
jgi:hypothetical protein